MSHARNLQDYEKFSQKHEMHDDVDEDSDNDRDDRAVTMMTRCHK